MKKLLGLVVAFVLAMSNILQANAEAEFSYEAGAEVVSAYLWRGTYCGGLSFQPSVSIGYEGDKTSFTFNVWGSVGASDWRFKKDLELTAEGYDPNTYFSPELDIAAQFSLFGFNVGFTHYYYFGGSNFFSWQPIQTVYENENTSTTEVQAGFDFGYWFENVPIYINWYTMVAGCDGFTDETTGEVRQNYTSYLELGFAQDFSHGWSLDANIGFSPWTSQDIYGNEGFAVQNLSLRLDKTWEWDACSLSIFAQGMLNPSAINKENVYIHEGGELKADQALNGLIGLGIWF
ncbi:MAG: hypothetical protein MJZ82_00805 [Paludibacteraceae bacterium]|nr:hypothetical protein [Paludibacteraceae bacterium]